MMPFLLAATLTITPAAGKITVDGTLDEAAWASALKVETFYEVMPGENIEPPVKTEAFLTYDKDSLYVGFKCYDPRPEEIRAHLGVHDATFGDDSVGVMLDTFHDQRRGYEFITNSVGVKNDILRSENYGEDDTWDTLWDAAGRRTEFGWTAEIALPFKSLRFADTPEQVWGLGLFRDYPRSLRHQIGSFKFDRNINCMVCQWDTLEGLRDIKPGLNVELIPSVTVQRSDARTDPEGPMEKGGTETELSLSGAWSVTPNLTLNGTLNPDFSQVEADVRQMDVNTRFALFYPEKRPFFMEGSDYFSTPFQLVYTRAIADPDWGVKLTGKEGKNAWGIIAAEDAIANFLLPANQYSDLASWDHPLTDGAFRFRRDVGENSTVGVLATHRQGGDYHNSVFAFDGRMALTDVDYFLFQAFASDTAYPELEDLGGMSGGDYQGQGMLFTYEHSGRDWYWMARYRELDPEARADLGFEPRVDYREARSTLYRTWWGKPGAFLSRIQSGLYGWTGWDFGGTRTDSTIGLDLLTLEMPLQTTLNFGTERQYVYYNGTGYDLDHPYLWFRARPTGNITVFFQVIGGEDIDYSNNRLADRLSLRTEFSLRPGRHFQVSGVLQRERLSISEGTVFTADLASLNLYYHFTSKFYVKGLVQFMDLERDPLLYSSTVSASEQSFSTQLLFTYRINPFTLAYLGYSDRGYGDDDIARTTTNRTFFLKLSYAWRP
jgi:hypothetical protein